MMKPHTQYTPPNHPNWTGKTCRTTDEAFGCQRYYAAQQKAGRRIWWLVIVAALILLAAWLLHPETAWLPRIA